MRHHILYIIAICVTAALASCASSAPERPQLTVSIEPLRYVTEAIAGERFEVTSLVPSGVSPETYDPTPAQIVALSRSRACLMVGSLGFELTYRERLMDNAPHLPFVDTAIGVAPIMDTHHHHGESEKRKEKSEKWDTGRGVPEEGHAHPAMEPHVWTSPMNLRIMATHVAETLISLDSEYEDYYTARYDSLCGVIARTDSTLRALLSAPEADRAFVIYHPALTYLARDYGLQQIAIEADGKEPTPARLVELTEEARKAGVHTVMIQAEFDTRHAQLIAEQIGARVEIINPLAYDWPTEIVRIATLLAPATD